MFMNRTKAKFCWKIIGILFSVVLIFTIAGCQTPQTTSSQSYPTQTNYVTVTNVVANTLYTTVTNFVTAQPKLEDSQTRNGLTLRDAQDKGVKLQPGLTQDELLLFFGKPDETSAGTYGTNTPKPWNGIMWFYRWGKIDSFPLNFKQLSITFENDSGQWVINSWQWTGQTSP
jgi:outer membrane protein assembly factor BamE (lipoprotein component of BamABCDE complex)